MGASTEYFAYIGTYTKTKSKGIQLCKFDTATGKLTYVGLAAETTNPTFLSVHPNQKFLYSVCEVSGGAKQSGAEAFSIDPATGMLKLLNQESSVGAGATALTVDRTGKCIIVANYGSGSVCAMPIKADGSLGAHTSFFQHEGFSANKARQTGPHAHSANVDPSNQFGLVCDLGLDKVFVYKLDAAAAKLTPNTPPSVSTQPGSGPRHLAFHPNGKWVYVIHELDNTMTTYAWDGAKGTLTPLQTISTLPADFQDKSACAEVEVHPNGRFVFGSNRGHESIATFSVDQATGKLTLVGTESTQGKHPRFFTLDPSAKWLLCGNQNTDNLVIYSVDDQTGKLKPTGQQLEIGAPVCIRFVPVAK